MNYTTEEHDVIENDTKLNPSSSWPTPWPHNQPFMVQRNDPTCCTGFTCVADGFSSLAAAARYASDLAKQTGVTYLVHNRRA